MNRSGLPDNVFRLIIGVIESLDMLEILIETRAAGREISLDELNEKLKLTPQLVRKRFGQLEAAGIVVPGTREDSFKYQPKTQELGNDVTALATAYARDRFRVVNLIASRNLERLRSVADAFRVRGKS